MDHLMIFVEIGTCARPCLLAIGLGLALTPARATTGFDLDSLMPTVPSRGSSGNDAGAWQPPPVPARGSSSGIDTNAWQPPSPAQDGSFGIENYANRYYYILAHGQDGEGIYAKPVTCRLHLAPKGMNHDKDSFRLRELFYFEIGVTGNLNDTAGSNWRVISLKRMHGIRDFPLGQNWNFEVNGNPPTINTMLKWKPGAASIPPKAPDPRRD